MYQKNLSKTHFVVDIDDIVYEMRYRHRYRHMIDARPTTMSITVKLQNQHHIEKTIGEPCTNFGSTRKRCAHM